MGLKRFLKELKDPSLKCERVGHNLREYTRRGYYEGGFMSVVTQVVQTTNRCERCGCQTEWKTTSQSGIRSFSAPEKLWIEIRKHSQKDPHWMEEWRSPL